MGDIDKVMKQYNKVASKKKTNSDAQEKVKK